MSGIEVAGLVLGSIPLIISALEDYADGVETIKKMIRYKKELRELVHDLQAEYCIFQDTCEWLLNGLTTTVELETLLENPEGWKRQELARSLEERLNSKYQVYMDRVTDMNETIQEFKAKLDLGKDGKVSIDRQNGDLDLPIIRSNGRSAMG